MFARVSVSYEYAMHFSILIRLDNQKEHQFDR